jgi:hypothetical protein
MTLNLWLDDVRPAPVDGDWLWVKTVEEARDAFGRFEFEVASLDHDLGHIADPNWDGDPREPMEITFQQYHIARSCPGADGIDLVKWMVKNNVYPTQEIIIHSWNPAGARNMYAEFMADDGCTVPVTIAPFEIPKAIRDKYMQIEHP